jgi:hypothetical protein
VMEWMVRMVTHGSEPLFEPALDLNLDPMMDELQEYGASVASTDRSWSVNLTVDADDPLEAMAEGRELIDKAAFHAGLPSWPVVELGAIEANTFVAQLEITNFPRIVGNAEAMQMLNVTRQRLHELRKSGKFPEPLAELAATPLWLRASVDSFLAGWKRRPGRPARDT